MGRNGGKSGIMGNCRKMGQFGTDFPFFPVPFSLFFLSLARFPSASPRFPQVPLVNFAELANWKNGNLGTDRHQPIFRPAPMVALTARCWVKCLFKVQSRAGGSAACPGRPESATRYDCASPTQQSLCPADRDVNPPRPLASGRLLASGLAPPQPRNTRRPKGAGPVACGFCLFPC